MNDTEKFDLHYTGVYVRIPTSVIVTAEVAELSEKQIDHTYVYIYFGGKWYMIKQWPNAIVSTAHIGLDPVELFFLTANGKVYRRAQGNITEEIIDASDEGPSDLLLMRRLLARGDELFAVGMARRAYQRSGSGTWGAIDDTSFVRRADRTSATGFNDVASSDGELIAVGYKGEIWRYSGNSWAAEDSPTNVTLTGVAATPDGFVIVGLAGLLIAGTPGAWRVVTQTATKADFWGIANFEGGTFVANYDGVFRFDGSDLQKVEVDKSRQITTAYLSATSGSIWSVGARDIYSSSDGVGWLRVENP